MVTKELFKQFIKENASMDESLNRSSLNNHSLGKVFEETILDVYKENLLEELQENKEYLISFAKTLSKPLNSIKDLKNDIFFVANFLKSFRKNMSVFEKTGREMNSVKYTELKRAEFVESMKFIQTKAQKNKFKKILEGYKEKKYTADIRIEKMGDFDFYYRIESNLYYENRLNLISINTEYGELFFNPDLETIFLKTHDDIVMIEICNFYNYVSAISAKDIKTLNDDFKFIAFFDSSTFIELETQSEKNYQILKLKNEKSELINAIVKIKINDEELFYEITDCNNKFNSFNSKILGKKSELFNSHLNEKLSILNNFKCHNIDEIESWDITSNKSPYYYLKSLKTRKEKEDELKKINSNNPEVIFVQNYQDIESICESSIQSLLLELKY